jgi:NADH-quinone oxidoreductase subunit G
MSPLASLSVLPTGLDDIATWTANAPPDELARLGERIAALIDSGEHADDDTGAIARALASARRPLIVSGVSCSSARILDAAAAIARALRARELDAALMLVCGEANSIGATLVGGALDMNQALEAIAGGETAAIVIENDLYRRAAPARVDAALAGARALIAIDAVETATSAAATVVLPAATYAESAGTFVNLETRAQRYYQVFEPAAPVDAAWRWLVTIAQAAGRNDPAFAHLDQVVAACALEPGLAGIERVAPGANYRTAAGARIPRQPARYSGRTAQTADVSVHEPKTTVDEESPFAFSMEGFNVEQPGSALPFVWAPGWNSNQSVFKFQAEVAGPLLGGDSGVRLVEPLVEPNGSRVLPSGADKTDDEGEGEGEFKLVPVYATFGSDELSALSPPIAERAAGPRLLLHPGDAARIGLRDGAGVRCEGLRGSAVLVLSDAIAPGHAGVVIGGAVAWLPARANVVAAPDHVGKPEVIARG